jgi:hypothetical protein
MVHADDSYMGMELNDSILETKSHKVSQCVKILE